MNVRYEDIITDMAHENRHLRNIIIDLLMSADCTWEERNEGHDWAIACEKARRIINPTPHNELPV